MKIVTDDIFDKGKQAFIYFVFGKKMFLLTLLYLELAELRPSHRTFSPEKLNLPKTDISFETFVAKPCLLTELFT